MRRMEEMEEKWKKKGKNKVPGNKCREFVWALRCAGFFS
jgi:hypothetical protein